MPSENIKKFFFEVIEYGLYVYLKIVFVFLPHECEYNAPNKHLWPTLSFLYMYLISLYVIVKILVILIFRAKYLHHESSEDESASLTPVPVSVTTDYLTCTVSSSGLKHPTSRRVTPSPKGTRKVSTIDRIKKGASASPLNRFVFYLEFSALMYRF